MRRAEKIIAAILTAFISFIGLRFLVQETILPAPERIGNSFEFRVRNITLLSRVVDKKAERTIFWFSSDTGPYPKEIEKLPNGEWRVILSNTPTGPASEKSR